MKSTATFRCTIDDKFFVVHRYDPAKAVCKPLSTSANTSCTWCAFKPTPRKRI
jgi:hypothetical protein